ncbi:MAG TPA: hypothetical protein VFT27_03785 [Actinomycetota bacterium]|nr:hypothetical protein [Actinomycetota bacterium]
MRRVRVGMLIGGIILGFIALVFLAGGVVLLWAYSSQRDADGYYAFDPEAFRAPGYAITSEDLYLGAPNEWFPEDLATVRISAGSDTESFIGIGRTADVGGYLLGVPYSVVRDVEGNPFKVTYRQVPGDAVPDPPTDQDFWVATDSGAGTQSLTWDLGAGNYTVVLMNADGSQGIDVQLSAGIKVDAVLPIMIGMLVVGLLLGASAAVLIVLSTRGRTPAAPLPPPTRPDEASSA